MKASSELLSNMAWSRLADLMDTDLSKRPPMDRAGLDEADLMLSIMRAVSEGKKRIQIDVKYPPPKPMPAKADLAKLKMK